MGDKAQTETTTTTTTAEPPKGTPPVGTETTVTAAPTTKETKAKEAKVETKVETSAGTEPKRATLKDDDDDIPNADLLELSPKALKARLARHSKSELRAKFGTDDFDDIKAKLQKLADYETKEESTRRAALDEKTRLEEDLARERLRAEAAEAKAQRVEENHIVSREESRIVRMAEKHLDPEYIEDQLPKLARHLAKTYSAKEMEKLGSEGTNKVIDAWFKDLVERKPKFGKDYETAKAEELKKQAKEDAKSGATKKPLTSGADTKDRPAAKQGADLAGKTYAPGKANSMTTAEAREQMRKEGYHY